MTTKIVNGRTVTLSAAADTARQAMQAVEATNQSIENSRDTLNKKRGLAETAHLEEIMTTRAREPGAPQAVKDWDTANRA